MSDKIIKKGTTDIAFRPTTLNEARCNSLTKLQNDLLDIIFGVISDANDNEDNCDYIINAKDIEKYFSYKNKKHVYEDLKSALDAVIIKSGSRAGYTMAFFIDDDIIPIFDKIPRYENGSLYISLTKKFKNLYIEESHRGLFYQVQMTISFNSLWAKKMYYYLADHVNYPNKKAGTIGVFTVDLPDFKNKLDCPKSYDKYKDFSKRVLIPGIQEINEKSNIVVTYKEIEGKTRSGQYAVVALEFTVLAKDSVSKEIIDIEPERVCLDKYKELKIILNKSKFASLKNLSDEELDQVYKLADNNNEKIIKALEIMNNTQNIVNEVAFFKAALKNNYKEQKKENNTELLSHIGVESWEDLENKLIG